MGAVRYRFRTHRRVHWRGWVLRGLLFGVAGATVLAAVAAARRTDSAYDRFLDAQNAYDVLLTNDDDTGFAVVDPEAVAALPGVEDHAVFDYTYVALGTGEAAIVDRSGRVGRDINRFKIVEGRTFDPDREDEAVVSFAVADRYGLEVGDEISLFSESGGAGDAIHVVGIEASPGEFPPHFPGAGYVHLSPASAPAPTDSSAIMVRLSQGAAGVPAFLEAVGELSGGAVFASIQEDESAETKRSIHLQAVAFWILAGVLAITAAALIAQVEARATHAEDEDFPILGSLGVSRWQRAAAALLGRLVIAAVAAVTAVLVAVGLSPLTPIGLARTAEPDLGLRLDPSVLLAGVVFLLIVLPLLAVPAILADLRRGAASIGGDGSTPTASRRSIVAGYAAGAGARPSTVTGIRLALDPGGGRDSVPVRSTLLGVTLAITVLAGALTFAACLDHLLDTPRLYGLVWNAQLTNYGSGPPLAAEAERLRGDPRVDALAVGESGVPATIDGQGTSLAYLDSPDDAALPPAIRGRAPEQDDEIALGARTADEVDASVGDEVTVEIEGLDSAPFRVSGILVLPSGQGSRLGEGGLIARAGTFRLGATEEQLTEDLFVQLADGVDADDVAASLPTEGESGNFAIPLDAPSDVVNFGRVDALPAILGGLLALLAIVTLAHTLVTAAQRRRRELALLKTLGFVAPQIRGAVRWQALTLVSLAIVVGLPTGAFAGRMAWTVLAEQLGVVPEPVTPVLALSLLVPAAVVVALLVAIVPARLAARTRPAAVLRAG